jgi:uncharacterized repeat protein (TIGR01451 family)
MVSAHSCPSGPGHARRLVGALITVVLGASFAQSTLPADAGAQAIPALDCTGNAIYQLQRASSGSTTGRLNTVDVLPMTPNYMGSVTATQTTTSLIPATNPGGNALGITEGGQGAWALAPQAPGGEGAELDFTLRFFNPATNAWTDREVTINTTNRLPNNVTAANIRSQGIVAGAVDPRSGNFYWAYLASAPRDRMVVFGYSTTTNQPIGVVAYSTLPQDVPGPPSTAGSNGDIAFDGAGNLFVVSNTGTSAAVGVIDGPLPTTEPTDLTRPNTRLTTFPNPDNNSYNGIAFNSIGELFIQWSTGGTTTTIRKISPQTGESLAGPSTVNFTTGGGGIGVDLGGCAAPPTMQLRKRVVARRADTDQFRLSINGGGLTQGNTATTSGTATGVQAATAGPVVARAGTTYTFTETGAGTTDLEHYGSEWRCVDQAADNAEVASGSGTTFTLTPASGQAILCTFTNDYPAIPGIDVDKTGVLDTGANGVADVGDIINYTIRVTNTGNVTLSNVRVTEEELVPPGSVPGLSAIVCPPAPNNVIPTLEPDEEVECFATYAVTQADIDLGFVPNFATATGTPPQGPDVTDGDRETVPITPAPELDVEKTGVLDDANNNETPDVGETINYTIRVTNTGNVTLRNVRVTEEELVPPGSVPGLSAIVCPPAPNNVIPTLEVGQEVDCFATYAVTQADVDVGFVHNFATATGTPPQGPDVTEGDDETVPISAAPELDVEKTGVLDTGANGVADVGDTINYTIRVRNTGNVTLRNVRVTERDLAGLSAIDCGGGSNVIAILRVGEREQCTATYRVTQADIDAGFVPNFATATGTPPQGPDVTDGDDETVPITAVPELNVVKTGKLDTGANGVAGVGDTIRYMITARNTGNVTLRNVRVTEQNLAGLAAIDCGRGTNVIAALRVGQSVRCTATYRVTQANVDAGYVPNFAIATGTPPRGPDVTDGDNHIEPIIRGLALHKTARPSVVARGSTVRFRLRVANTSRASVHGVRVCDRQPRGFTVASAPRFRVRGRTVCKFIGILRPGRSRTLAFTARAGARAPSRVTNISTATARNARSVRARARVRIVGRPPSVTG